MRRQILGHKVAIGDLYNATKDIIITDANMFDSELPEDEIEVTQKDVRTFAISKTDFNRDRLPALGVSTATGASFAAGLVKPSQASLFLNTSTPNSSTQQMTAICITLNKLETLNMSSEELKSVINTEVLAQCSDQNPTHVVVGVERGARMTITLQSSDTTSKAAHDISQDLERLAGEIGRCFKPDGEGEEEDADASPAAEIVSLAESYEIKCRSDFTIKSIKTDTFAGISKFARKLPTVPEKATYPLSVQLMPIQEFLESIQGEDDEQAAEAAAFKELDDELLTSIIQISDKIGTEKKASGDLLGTLTKNKASIPVAELDRFSSDKSINTFEDKFKSEVGGALQKARGGKMVAKLRALVGEYGADRAKDPSKLNSKLKPWADKVRCLEESKVAGIPVATLSAITAKPSKAPGGGTDDALCRGDVFAFYISAAATIGASFDKVKDKALTLAKDKTNRVVIVDLDVDNTRETYKGPVPCIQLRRNGKAIVSDLVADEEELSKMCLIRRKNTTSSATYDQGIVALEKRLPVIMACPHPQCTESGAGATTSWMCPSCKEQVTFGFVKAEDHYSMYCNCGAYDMSLAEYRCNNASTHGIAFVPWEQAGTEDAETGQARLRDYLCQMKPFEQYNILIMGATGAGKSTFINAFVNYLLYDSLEDAMDAEQLTYAIPGSFSVPDSVNANAHVEVSWGQENETESLSKQGQSATQSCVIYAININGKLLRLVDTPGLGDTRGIDQDYKNVADIMRILESLDTISSILFVVKNNESRLTTSFDFVLSELMLHLHKDTIKNIMFGFSYGRTSIPPFAVGTVGAPLMDLLRRKELPMQKLVSDQNAFVFDAEGFLNVAAWQQKRLNLNSRNDVATESWKISAEKARLLINVTMSLPMHDTKETLRLERNRRLVDGMSETMVNMSSAMTKTMTDVNAKLAEIKELEDQGIQISKKHMQYTRTSLIEEKLPYPRTVCKADGCASDQIDPATNMPIRVFDKSCHEDCAINTPEAKFGPPELGQCMCFNSEGANCNICGHSFMSHCHITYRQKFVTVTVTDQAVVDESQQHDQKKLAAENWKSKLEGDKIELQLEQNMVTVTMARFSIYLGANSVARYNDGVVEHLKYLMENAKKDGNGAAQKKYSEQILQHEKLIKERKQQIADNTASVPTSQDIEHMLKDLKAMKVYGQDFCKLLERKDALVPHQAAIPIKVSKTGSWARLAKWMGRK